MCVCACGDREREQETKREKTSERRRLVELGSDREGFGGRMKAVTLDDGEVTQTFDEAPKN